MANGVRGADRVAGAMNFAQLMARSGMSAVR